MKTTVVPAQVTSMEDTIAGSLSLTQVVLLIIPVFISAFLFAGLPPSMHIKLYKLILLLFIGLPPLVLAIRFKGVIALRWLFLISSYRLRPTIYLQTVKYHHDCYCLRFDVEDKNEETIDALTTKTISKKDLSISERFVITSFLKQKSIKFYTDERGKINASIQ